MGVKVFSSYSISKATLISLVNCGSKHIRVNSVALGAINKDMNTENKWFSHNNKTN